MSLVICISFLISIAILAGLIFNLYSRCDYLFGVVVRQRQELNEFRAEFKKVVYLDPEDKDDFK